MISLRKHIDDYIAPVHESVLSAFRASLIAMAQSGERAVPALGPDLSRKLGDIHGALHSPVLPDELASASTRLETELSLWADLAIRKHDENTREMKEIVDAVARAAESVSRRDEKYSDSIGRVTGKLKSIAEIDDLAAVRRSIVESAAALKTCVEQMAEESKASVEELAKEVEHYRERLRETERLSASDALTGLANRRAFEGELQIRMAGRVRFSLIMVDLNGFKEVNDRYGHLAGDDLLKQFANELGDQFTDADLVARWGGDEFAILVTGDVQDRVDRIRKWAFGDYKVNTGSEKVKVRMEGALGIAQWNGSETGAELLARADAGVYKSKPTRAPAAVR